MDFILDACHCHSSSCFGFSVDLVFPPIAEPLKQKLLAINFLLYLNDHLVLGQKKLDQRANDYLDVPLQPFPARISLAQDV